MKGLRKIMAFALILTLCLPSTVPVFAISENSSEDDDFDINNYTQYTIDLTANQPLTRSINSSEETSNDGIDEAIEYVESLDLELKGYAHIEEACLSELESYKSDDIILESYTVLVPTARAENYYGTYLGSKFYYEYTSVADMRRNTNGAERSASNTGKWTNWILGTTDLILSFTGGSYSIAYSVIRSITGIAAGSSDVHYGSYNQYVEQFTNTRTRTIYKLSGSTYKACCQDQSSSLRINQYFCPVGTKFPKDYYELGTRFNGTVNANNLSKDEILKTANTYANHGGKAVYSVTSKRIVEKW